ncbi:MAG: hypothetical protein ACOZNI_21505 [Myxococcota bacterium]
MHDLPSSDTLLRASKALAAQSKALAALARAVSPPTPGSLAKALDSLERAGEADAGAILRDGRAWLDAERAGRRERLATGLKSGCAEAGIELLVVSKEPLELRLPPFAARVDVERDRAELCFGGLPVAESRADASGLLAAHRTAFAAIEGRGWDPAAQHRLLRRAWARLRAETGQDWIELADVLPEVTLLRQPRAFRAEPVGKRFEPYPRASFVYDLWRLRRDRMLSVDGWRLSLGPATGGSTMDRQRVFFVEDDRGQGQWQLTVRFTKEDT